MIGASMFPDADIVAFAFGIPYAAPWGHRGATHSFVFAAIAGFVVWLLARVWSRDALRLGVAVGCVMATHGLLDTLTDGGLGAALLWPVSNHRFFAPWQPIPVAPIGPAIVAPAGLLLMLKELLLFLPALLIAFWPRRHP